MACSEDADFALALRLQEEEHRLAGVSSGSSGPLAAGGGPALSQKGARRGSTPPPRPPPGTSLVDEAYELIDPTPDIYQLFRDFDRHFFWGKLGSVELKWSPRMTRCAGVCSYQPASGLCSVRLSRPLLTLRPRSDLVETLLHEMIHALLFVTHNSDNREEHGPEFHRHMHRINKIAGTNISVYHTFHDEVRHMLTHWWRCTGPCRRRPPHLGFVKRSMNRAPSKNDFWWRDHQASCGGTFEKIKEPEGYGKKKTKKEIATSTPKKLQDIRNFVVSGKVVPPVKKPLGCPNGTTKPPRAPTAGGVLPQGGPARPGGAANRKPPTKRPPGQTGKRPTSESGGGAGPSKRPTGARPGGTPTGARPGGIPTGVRPAGNPTGARPAGNPTGVRPAGNPTGVRPAGNPTGVRPAGNPTGVRPAGNPTGVRAGIGSVTNAGNQRVNNISNNVHGFQKTARGGGTALRGGAGSRTVTVPPRRGDTGGGRTPAGAGVAEAPFGGRGQTLGGARSVPWYKRDPPPTQRAAPPATRPPTGIFSSPETDTRPGSAVGSEVRRDTDLEDAFPDTVTCPVCGEKVSVRGINDHVDLCLVAACARTGKGEPSRSPPCSGSVWDEDSEDDQLLAEAADKLETSLEVSFWEEDDADEQALAEAADELETSLELQDAPDKVTSDGGDTYKDDGGATFNNAGDAAPQSPASDASTVYDEILDNKIGMAAGDVDSRSPASDASTVYDDIMDGPIVIDSSSDEEDYSSQRANLSATIKQFIRADDSEDEIFDD